MRLKNRISLFGTACFAAGIFVCLVIGLAGCGGGGGNDSGGGSSPDGSSPVQTLGYTLTGKVVLPDGSSGPGILVLASQVDEGGVSRKQARVLAARPAVRTSFNRAVTTAASEAQGSYATVTDTNGVYVLTGLDTGTYYIEATRGGLKAKGRGTVSPLEATVVDLALTPTGSITGYCLLSDQTTGGHAGTFVIIKGTDYIGFTGDDGGFIISQVPVGDYQVSFMHPGYESADYSSTVTVPAADAAVLESSMELTALVGGTISGTVLAQDELPVEGVMVRLMEDDYFAETDGNGTYQFDGIQPGEYTVGFRHDLIDNGALSEPVQVTEGSQHTVDTTLHDDRAPGWESTAGVTFVTSIDGTSYGQTTPAADTLTVAVEFGRVLDASAPLTFTVYHNTAESWDAEAWENNITTDYSVADIYDGIRGEQGVVLEGIPATGRFIFGVRAKDRHGNMEYNLNEYLFVASDSGTTPEERDNLLTAVGSIGIGTRDPQGLLHVEAADGSSFVVDSDTGNVGIGTTDPHAALTVGSTGQTQPGSTTGTFAVDSSGNIISGAWQGDAIADDYIETVSGSKITGDITASQVVGDIPSSQIVGDIPSSQVVGDIPSSQIVGDIPSSQVVGDIPSSQIAGDIPSSQIVGDIPSSQITGDIPGSQIAGDITGNAANVTGTVTIANGGTGAATAEDARANLGLGSLSILDTVAGGTAGAIQDGTITNDDIGASAAIDFSKLNIVKSDITGLGIPGDDTGASYSAGLGITLENETFSLDPQDAANGQVLKWSGAAWEPADDADTQLSDSDIGTLGYIKTDTKLSDSDIENMGYIKTYTETDPSVDLAKLQQLVTNDYHNLGGTDADTQLSDSDIANMGYIKTDTTLSDEAIATMGYIKTYTETDPKIGTITTGYVPKWDGTALTAGAIFDDGTNVGIGTSTPTSALDVSGTIKATAFQGDGSALTNLSGGSSILTNDTQVATTDTGTDGTIAFTTDNIERMRIIANGNVGIGTTNPNHQLCIVNASGNSSLAVGESSTVNGSLSWNAANDHVLLAGTGFNYPVNIGPVGTGTGGIFVDTYANDGKVGIGTTVPAALLDVQGGAQFGSGNVDLVDATGRIPALSSTYFASLDGSALTNLPGCSIITTNDTSVGTTDTGTDGTIAFTTDNTEVMRATADGNVGIGTATPGAKLHLVDGSFRLESTSTAGSPIQFIGTGDNWSVFASGSGNAIGTGKLAFLNTTDAEYRMVIDTDGNVGVGTTDPVETLDVAGSVALRAQGELKLKDSDSSNYVSLKSPATVAADVAWILPAADGTADQVLKTDGSGTLSWTTAGGGASEINDLSDGKSDGNSVFLGTGSGASDDGSDNHSVAIGMNALSSNTTSEENTAVGESALQATTGMCNTAVGYRALWNNTGGMMNNAIGSGALMYATSGDHNNAMGRIALWKNTTGENNIGIGSGANAWNQAGNNNTIIGCEAGYGTANHDKSGCVMIGYQAGYNDTNSNKLYIENSNSDTPLIYGEFDNDILAVNGDLQLKDGTAVGNIALYEGSGDGTNKITLQAQAMAADYTLTLPAADGTADQVLTTDGAGTLSWATAAGGSSIWTEDTGFIKYNGDVGIGTTDPGADFAVSGSAAIGSAYYQNTAPTNGLLVEGTVGIGTAAPESKLHVSIDSDTTYSGTTWVEPVLRVSNLGDGGAANAFAHLELLASSTPTKNAVGVINVIQPNTSTHGAEFAFQLRQDNGDYSEIMRMKNSGKVGIGTTAPGADLHIKSGASGQTPTNVLGLYIENNGASNGWFAFQTATAGGGKSFSITNDGKVGIGSTLPGSTLDVKGEIRLSGSTSGHVGLAPAAAAGSTTYILPAADGTADQVLSTDGSGTLSWATAGGGSSQWDDVTGGINYASGKVGIGTTTPGSPFHVYNATDGNIRIESGANATLFLQRGASGNTSQIMFQEDASDLFQMNAYGDQFYMFNYGSSKPALRIFYSTNNIALVPDGGNIGIGNTDPAEKLDVAGNVALRAQGELKLKDSDSSNFVSLKSPATVAADVAWTLPAADGTADQVLKTDGSGTLSWATAGGGGASVINDLSDAVADAASVFIGTGSGANKDGTNLMNTAVGISALGANTTGYWNTAIGYHAAKSLTSGYHNTAVGKEALYSASNAVGSCTALGIKALYSNTAGHYNTAVGDQALFGTSGSKNTGVGNEALKNSSSGDNNVAIGFQAGLFQADGSTALTTPANSIYIGNESRGLNNSDNNSIVIGYQAIGIGANSVVLGNGSITKTALKGNVGIGTDTPGEKLDVVGNVALRAQGELKLKDSDSSNYVSLKSPATVAADVAWTLPAADGTADQVLTTDGSGVLSWATASGGTATNITTDDTQVATTDTGTDGIITFTTENSEAMRITADGKVGIGTTNPGAKLHLSDSGDQSIALTRADGTFGWEIYRNNAAGSNTFRAKLSDDTTWHDFIKMGEGETSHSVAHLVLQGQGGNVGIGTPAPAALLDVQGGAQFGSGNVDLVDATGKIPAISSTYFASLDGSALTNLSGGSNITTDDTQVATTDTGTDGIITFTTENSEAMRITNAGNVGIGTTAPAETLDVVGNVSLQAQGELKLKDSDSSNYVSLKSPATVAADVAWTLPAADGTADQVLTTDGSGTLSWATAGGASALTDLSDVITDASCVFLGSGSGANDDGSTNRNVAVGIDTLTANTTGYQNVGVGYTTLASNTTGNGNVAMGYRALNANTDGNSNVAVGNDALKGGTSTDYNTALGYSAMSGLSTTGNYNTAVGINTLSALTTGETNIAAGCNAMQYATSGSSNVAVGYYALRNGTSAAYNVGVGPSAGHNNQTGYKNVFVGNAAGYSALGGYNVFIGSKAGYAETGSNKLYIDSSNDNDSTPLIYGDFVEETLTFNANVGIGTTTIGATLEVVGTVHLRGAAGVTGLVVDGSGNVGIGSDTPGEKLDVKGTLHLSGSTSGYVGLAPAAEAGSTTYILPAADGTADQVLSTNGSGTLSWATAGGASALNDLSDAKYDTSSLFLGSGSGANDDGSNANTGIGRNALTSNTTGSSNTAVGYYSLRVNSTGISNSAFGREALDANIGGNYNSAVGYQSLKSNTSGQYNTAFGNKGLYSTTTGLGNVTSGSSALYNNTTGSYNVALGYNAGSKQADGSTNLVSPDNSIYIGSNVRGYNDSDNNSIVIGYMAIGLGANTVVLGNDNITTTALKGNVGIGTTAPSYPLHVRASSGVLFAESTNSLNGAQIRMQAGGASDVWKLNALPDAGSNPQDFSMAYGSSYMMRVSDTGDVWAGGTSADTAPVLAVLATGNVGIGTTSPGAALDVVGANIWNTYYGNYSNYFLQRANGTSASPTTVADTNLLGTYRWNGYDGDSFEPAAQIQAKVTGTVADGKIPGQLDFFTKRDSDGDWSSRMTIADTGNVGIGTTTPGVLLDVVSTSNQISSFSTTASWGEIRVISPTARALMNAGDSVMFGSDSNHDVHFGIGRITKAVLDTSGNFGIGTTAPATTMEIRDASHTALQLRSTGSDAAAYLKLVGKIGGADRLSEIYADYNGGLNYNAAAESSPYAHEFLIGGTTEMVIKNDGNVGIGTTSPTELLQVGSLSGTGDRFIKVQADSGYNTGIKFVGSTADVWHITHHDTTRILQIGMDSSEYVTIKEDGSVGIGTDTPTSTLHVNGSLSKSSGSFDIPHPDPEKKEAGYRLRHCFVESPTRGDNLYRFQVEVTGGEAVIDLPDYFKHLNEDVQVWVSAEEHFGRAYGKVNPGQTAITVTADSDGIYNVLAVGTRKDGLAKDWFDENGVEYVADTPAPLTE